MPLLSSSVVFGSVPKTLRGAYFRIGPHPNNKPIKHVFDGDGLIEKYELGDTLSVKAAFVKTPEFEIEEKARAVMFRSAFGTQPALKINAFDHFLKNPANTNLLHHAGKLATLWEGGGSNYEIDQETLETLSPLTIQGVTNKPIISTENEFVDNLLGVGGTALGAHTHVDPSTGEMFAFTTQIVAGGVNIKLLEFCADSFTLSDFRTVKIPHFTLVHDFCFTQKYSIFFAAHMKFDNFPYIAGIKGPAECITHLPKKTSVYFVSRTDEKIVVIELDESFFVTHFINAFDTTKGFAIVDCMATGRVDTEDTPRPKPMRFAFDLVKKEAIKFEYPLFGNAICEFPSINNSYYSKPYNYAYCTCFSSWQKINTRTSAVQMFKIPDFLAQKEKCIFLEPVFISNGVAEDDGLLIGVVLCEDFNYFLIVDAKNLELVFAASVEIMLETGLHGLWVVADEESS